MFVRVCQGLSDRGKLIPLKQGAIKDLYKTINKEKDHYISLFQFNENQNKQFAETGTISGITDVIADRLTWDFDSESSLELARTDALTLCERLVDEGYKENQIQVYFSGNKGFEVTVQLVTSSVTPNEMKNICLSLAKGLSTIDTKIYNASRIFRLPLTKHQVSGLYKIPLSITDLSDMNVDEIVNSAKENLDYEQIESAWKPAVLTKALLKLKEASVKPKQKQIVEFTEELDLSNKPKWLSNWKYALSRGYYGSGMRNHALMILAATCRGNGFSDTQAYYFLKAANDEQSRRYNSEKFSKEEIWNNIIKVVYSPNWQGGTYAEENFPEEIKSFLLENGIKRGNEKTEGAEPISTMVDIGNNFTDYIHSFENNSLHFGLEVLDKEFPMPAGTNVGIIGAASSGKTAVALKLLSNAAKEGMVCVFASLDMSRSRMFEKMLYKVTGGMKREDIFEMWKTSEGRKKLLDLVNKEFGTVYMFNKSSPTIENIRDYINQVETHTGKKVELLMIDYFERVMSDFSDDTKASKMVASGIQDIVNDMPHIRAITLCQPNKMSLGGGPDNPILSYTAIKGSSFLYQSFRQIIALWRPFFTPQTKEYDKYMQMAILKNDLGELGTFDFGWTGKTGEIYELEDIQRQELKELLRNKTMGQEDDDF